MDLERLKQRLEGFAKSLKKRDRKLLKVRLNALISAFPFNEYEFTLMFLLDQHCITFDEYETLRQDYVSSNKYLELYGLAPRIFGESWHEHLMDLDDRFGKPSESIDPDFEGQYDLSIDGVRVEVKAARAINTKVKASLVSKALCYDSLKPFWMNYQQIKLDTCDVFVFIGVWVDRILYWVLSNDEVKQNEYLSHQHRGGVEYQIGIKNENIGFFDQYLVKPSEIGAKVIEKGRQGSS